MDFIPLESDAPFSFVDDAYQKKSILRQSAHMIIVFRFVEKVSAGVDGLVNHWT